MRGKTYPGLSTNDIRVHLSRLEYESLIADEKAEALHGLKQAYKALLELNEKEANLKAREEGC